MIIGRNIISAILLIDWKKDDDYYKVKFADDGLCYNRSNKTIPYISVNSVNSAWFVENNYIYGVSLYSDS